MSCVWSLSGLLGQRYEADHQHFEQVAARSVIEYHETEALEFQRNTDGSIRLHRLCQYFGLVQDYQA